MQILARQLRWFLLLTLIIAAGFIWRAVVAEEHGAVLTIAFLDVGQGDAIFIQAPSGNQMLIDGGAGSSVLRELGKQLPAHDRSIDIIVATHPDQDHIGGLPAVLERYAISYVFRSGAVHDTSVYRAFNTAIQNEDGIQEVLARRGTRIDLGGGAYFEILFPDRDVSKADPNDASIVGRLVYGEIEVMLTGDAPNSIERYLVSLDGKALGSDILKIGHHGSKTSSSNEFIGFVGPDYGIISAGCDNRYGHPHQDVLSVLAQFDIEILGTCEEGTIVFEADGATLWRR